MFMAISWIKSVGMDVFEIENLEDTDKKIKELIDRKYNTIIISNELASFSQDIITKYKNMESINIIISHK